MVWDKWLGLRLEFLNLKERIIWVGGRDSLLLAFPIILCFEVMIVVGGCGKGRAERIDLLSHVNLINLNIRL